MWCSTAFHRRCCKRPRAQRRTPDVFAPDDFGHCEVLVPEPEGALADAARIGAENCPERAIRIED